MIMLNLQVSHDYAYFTSFTLCLIYGNINRLTKLFFMFFVFLIVN